MDLKQHKTMSDNESNENLKVREKITTPLCTCHQHDLKACSVYDGSRNMFKNDKAISIYLH